jgi:hypothetical protein
MAAPMAKRSVLGLFLGLALASTLPVAVFVSSALATTESGLIKRIDVTVDDEGIRVERLRWERGTVAHFEVVNNGTRPHNFVIGFWRSRVLQPGERQQVEAPLTLRGFLTFRSTLDCGASHRGRLVVF